MTLKKLLILPILFLIINCSYEPIFSEKNINSISIGDLTVEGNKKINRLIANQLNINRNDNQDTSYDLNLNSSKKVETLAKDSRGNDSIYRTIITVNLTLKKQELIFKEKSFVLSFSYNNIENKFDLSEYQKNIETDLINKIIQEINIYLSS
jgi:hypothetical protein|tara:strand:- start:193 stop:648 length:456 start_codon:yes stop_codon:yes gene_type:complete